MADEFEQWLSRLGDLWRTERTEERERLAAERRELSLPERIRRGVALRDLEVLRWHTTPGDRIAVEITARQNDSLASLRIDRGAPVRLWWKDPDEADRVTGTVARRGRTSLRIHVAADDAERLEVSGFRLDREESETTYRRGAAAITMWRRSGTTEPVASMKSALVAPESAAADLGELVPFDAGLNELQRAAVALALVTTPFALIHGPPGTGKTRTVVELIRQCVARGQRVLATASSNAAVDNVAIRCAETGVLPVRIGSPARVAPELEDRTLDALLEQSEEWALAQKWYAESRKLRKRVSAMRPSNPDEWREYRGRRDEARELSRDARRYIAQARARVLSEAQLVCATATGAGARLLDDEPFDVVVIDEATQLVDPIALGVLARASHVVLAGDPQQLPPTVLSPAAESGGLGVTIFERLIERGAPSTMLREQYRMHEDIMRFPSTSMYGGQLEAHASVAARGAACFGAGEDPLRPSPLVFIDAAGKGWGEVRDADDPSTANPEQGRRTVAEARRLISRGFNAEQVAVITPYDAQAQLLSRWLTDEIAEGLRVSSIDGFQGQESPAVLVDLVRSNDEQALGFLTDVRRMNVALTRAQAQLIVIGDSGTIGAHPFYASFLDAVQAHGAWVSAWSDEAPPIE